MVKLNTYYKISYDNNEYSVCELNYGSKKAPVILDWKTFKRIKSLDISWYINGKGFVVTNYKFKENGNDVVKEISMHDVVMKMTDNEYDSRQIKSVLHINKLGVDNRTCNLIYDTCDKDITKNLKKKNRTISLPEDLGILPNEIPSYVWYLKEDSTHGDRFIVNIDDISWKSTASKKMSLRYKLEETKKYMRHLQETRPDIFDNYSMNGDLNEDGEILLKEFLTMAKIVGFKLNECVMNRKTDDYLKENLTELCKEEKTFLEMFNPEADRINFR
jgi:hypothetical protein